MKTLLLNYIKTHRLLIFVVLVFISLEAAFFAAVPLSLKFLIDEGLLGDNEKLLLSIVVGLGVASISVSAIVIWRNYLYAGIASQLISTIRKAIFLHINQLGEAERLKVDKGKVVAHFTIDLQAIEEVTLTCISWLIMPALVIFFNIFILFYLSWQLSLITLLIGPLALVIPRMLTPYMAQETRNKSKHLGNFLSFIHENLDLFRVIKIFNLKLLMKSRFKESNAAITSTSSRLIFWNEMMNASGEIVVIFLQILLLGIGSYLVYTEGLSVGSLISFYSIFTEFIYSIGYITQYMSVFTRGMTGMERIQAFLGEPIKKTEAEKTQTIEGAPSPPALVSGFHQALIFDRVSFAYHEKTPVLSDISFEIRPGTSAAFVGFSGAGKSTIINLLLRFYLPHSGRITLDGHALHDIPENNLYQLVSCIFQENLLFNMSIEDNLRMGKSDATQEEIETVTKALKLHEKIQTMPQGYHGVVGEKGSRLSGGEAQRVAIARALLKAPPILLIDEATSMLDTITEAVVQEALDARLSKGFTNILITHRLYSTVKVDQIFVLSGGKIIQSGRHDHLLTQEGIYRSLWHKQSRNSSKTD